MTAPRYRSWRLQTTSVGQTAAGLFSGVVLILNAAFLIRDGLWWVSVPAMMLFIPLTVGWVLGAVTLWRQPDLRDTDLLRRPIRQRDLYIRTALLLASVATVAVGAAGWALTSSWKPWVPILCFGSLLTLGAFIERYQLADRAYNEAQTNQVTPQT